MITHQIASVLAELIRTEEPFLRELILAHHRRFDVGHEMVLPERACGRRVDHGARFVAVNPGYRAWISEESST